MIPVSIYVLIAIGIAFSIGFFIGKKTTFGGSTSKNGVNQQNAPRFVDSEVARMMGEKGRKTQQERIKKRKARIMERAKREGRITNDDVEDLFCISDSTARNYLNELEHSGLLTQHGTSGRGVFYTPSSR